MRKHLVDKPMRIVLVGTKLDLREDPDTMRGMTANKYLVTYEMGMALKEEIGAHAFIETSSKTQKGLKESFNAAIEVVLEADMGKHRDGKSSDDSSSKSFRKRWCTIQ